MLLFVNEMSFRSSCGWAQSQMDATGSMRKQETESAQSAIDSLNTTNNIIDCVAMNDAHM